MNILITGRPGIGKTTLIKELAEKLAGKATGSCLSCMTVATGVVIYWTIIGFVEILSGEPYLMKSLFFLPIFIRRQYNLANGVALNRPLIGYISYEAG